MNDSIVVYDFDGTLTPYPMPKFEILEKIGVSTMTLSTKANQIVQEKNIDLYLAIYEVYLEVIKNSNLKLVDENFVLGANRVCYNKGVNAYLECLCNNNVKNYLLSSGIKVFLEKTEVSQYFEKIYATTFSYNNEEVVGIDYLMSDRNKVNAIKEIIRDNGNIKDDCSNIIYVGDGLTDKFAFEYVHNNGGKSIFVYNNEENINSDTKDLKNIIDLFAKADYSKGSKLNNYIMDFCKIKK